MTNFEKYKDDIKKITNACGRIAISKASKKLCSCEDLEDCPDCLFGSSDRSFDECYAITMNWLLSEYEEPRWTPEDVALAKALKMFGVKYIERYSVRSVEGFNEEKNSVVLITGHANAFKSVDVYQRIDIDTIIEEAEE